MGVGVEQQGRLLWQTGLDPAGFNKGLSNINGGLNNAEKNTNKLADSFKNLGGLVAGYLSVSALTAFGKEILSITGQFQKFKAVLTNTLGSNILAESAMQQIQEFASKTPFQVTELTEAFVKLANMGFVPTGKQMRQLGDIAASTGKSFDQLAEAILDAQTGEYERLKEFGIRAKDAGDQVIFTFKGVATTVDKTSSSIRDYITGLGDAQGVTGSMQAIAHTLNGQISELEDNWDRLLTTIGNGTEGVFKGAISALNQMLSAATEYVEKMNIASKYNLESQSPKAAAYSTGALTGFGGIGAFVTSFFNKEGESQSDLILQLNKGLTEQNSKFIDGAKSVKAYANEFQRLNKLRLIDMRNATDPKVRAAIDSEYQQAMSALKANANKLIQDRLKKADSNFGTGKAGSKSDAEKQAERIADAYKKLDNELTVLGLDKKLSLQDVNDKKISAYEGLLRSLVENGMQPTDKAVVSVTDKIFKLTQELYKFEGNKFGIDMLSKEFRAFAEDAVKAQEKFKSTVQEMENMVGSKTMDKLTSPPELKDNSKHLKKMAEDAYEVSSAFYDWSDALSTVDEGLSNALGQIGSLAFGVSRLSEALATGNGVGIIGAAGGIIGGLIKGITSAGKTEREQAAYTQQLQIQQTDALTKAIERQVAAINEAYGTDRINKYNESLLSVQNTYDGLAESLKGKYTLSDDSQINKAIEMINQGGKPGSLFTSVVEAMANGGAITDLSKYAEGLADIANNTKAINELQSLLDMGKLDKETSAAVSNIIKQAEIYKNTLNALRAETTGTTFNAIADSITDMFEKGTTSAKEFADNFQSIMKNAIMNTFKRNYLEKELQGFYDTFYDYSSSGGELTEGEIATLEALYNGIIANGEKRFADLQKLSGISFSGSNDATGLTGGIASALTEATGSELAGLWRGQYDISKKQHNALLSIDLKLAKQAEISSQKLNHLIAINKNTANTVEEVKNVATEVRTAVKELKSINQNTGGRTDRDPG